MVMLSESYKHRLLKLSGIKLNENSASKYQYVVYDEYNDVFEDLGIDSYEAYDDALQIAKEGGVNILSNKELVGILIQTELLEVVGGLWVSYDNDSFSFDIAISKKHQGKGLSHRLIKAAMSEYNIQNDTYQDMHDGKALPMQVDVINPLLAATLEKHYGFTVYSQVGPDRVIMTRK